VQVSQKPPASVNGVLYRDGVLWLASLSGGELVAADAATGAIIGRFGPAQGVNTGPDDLVMKDDGTIYWTGQATGDIGVLTPDGHSRKLVNLGAGVNPIVFAADGQLLVGRAYQGKGLHRVDPATGRATTLNANLAINGSVLAADGTLLSPTTTAIPFTTVHVVRTDPTTGRSTTIGDGTNLSSVKIPPASRGEQPGTIYVLQGVLPAVVHRIDATTGRSAARDIPIPGVLLADNMTFAPDGRLFVTNTVPQVTVVEVGGRTHTVNIGKA
jgi:sugar lactone lactonase YvrE